jgi:putative Holliday junction resolvase
MEAIQGPGCVLGLDYGSQRIGLAVSDNEGVFAFPAGALERTGLKRDLAALAALIAERGVTRVVVGLPLHMSGRGGPEAAAARAFAQALRDATQLPVDLLDERWTSREAERALRDAPGKRSAQRAGGGRSPSGKRSAQRAAGERSSSGKRSAQPAGGARSSSGRRKRSRGSVDSVAATLLLRTYLERERGGAGGTSG